MIIQYNGVSLRVRSIMSEKKTIEYWRLQNTELFNGFSSSQSGIDEAEAVLRRKLYGPNEIPHLGHRTSINILFTQFKSPLVYVLIAASALSLYIRDTNEAIIIFIIMLVNAGLGFAQEYRSEKALEEISKYLSFNSVVIRNRKRHVVDTRELVPGDVVYFLQVIWFQRK